MNGDKFNRRSKMGATINYKGTAVLNDILRESSHSFSFIGETNFFMFFEAFMIVYSERDYDEIEERLSK